MSFQEGQGRSRQLRVRETHLVGLDERRHLHLEAEVLQHLAPAAGQLWRRVQAALDELLQELRADLTSRADDRNRQLRVRERERGVCGAQGLRAVVLLDADRDLPLARALRARAARTFESDTASE